jgi:hypothetical protein
VILLQPSSGLDIPNGGVGVTARPTTQPYSSTRANGKIRKCKKFELRLSIWFFSSYHHEKAAR